MISHHVNAAGAQLRQLRTALHLAVALNRTLIMPKVERAGWVGGWGGADEWLAFEGGCCTRLAPWRPSRRAPTPPRSSYRGATATGGLLSFARCESDVPAEPAALPPACRLHLPVAGPPTTYHYLLHLPPT